jgi:dipeptidyl aminopeptidase/acylaminoacyl peptidase
MKHHLEWTKAAWATLAIAILTFIPTMSSAQDLLTPERLWEYARISDPQISPDGSQVVFTARTFDIKENRGNTELYIVSSNGGEPTKLTNTPASESNPRWRPDGRKIGFLSSASGSSQLWEMNPDGSNVVRVTDIDGGISNFDYSPKGNFISFTKSVKLDQTMKEKHPDMDKSDVHLYDGLMYRHWSSWSDYTYSHVFYAPYADGRLTGDPVDIMAGERFHSPVPPFGGGEQIGWSPDERYLAYTSKKLIGTEFATSTNNDIYMYSLADKQTRNASEGYIGYDIEPRFSPDGRYLAWLSMETPGYEADRNRIILLDLTNGSKREVTEGFDQNASGLVWGLDSRTMYFESAINATQQLYRASITGDGMVEISTLTKGTHDLGYPSLGYQNGTPFLITTKTTHTSPAELYRISISDGTLKQITDLNGELQRKTKHARVEKRMVPTTDGKEMLTWVIYPPDFDPSKKYPTLLYCQGGPQSTVSQFFSYRWNFNLMAANGYIIVAPNRRGLPSFGQDWNREISGDWGGQAMQDLLSAIDHVAQEPYVDNQRLGAIGASFGGFSVFWLAGNHEGRFKSFIAHAGVFNLESMYGHTEEIFFSNFDMQGAYWEDPQPVSYRKFSPHLFVQNWDTPILIIHGAKDFRVPESEGMQAFTSAQLRGIPSKFLYFPNENHWILTPQNGIVWQREFFGWLDQWLK